MPQYTSITLSSAIAQLSSELNDPTNIHWTTAELQLAIVEALRIFQALTGFYRERVTVNTVNGQPFYDLRITTPTQYAFTVTDNNILTELQYHFIEPPTNPWTGTAQFNIADIASAMQRLRDQYLTDTGIYVTRSTISTAPPPIGRIPLAQTFIDLRRAAWKDSTSLLTYPLVRTDEYAAFGYSPTWPQNPALPNFYSLSVTPPVSLQAIPAPNNSGTLDICTLDTGPALACAAASPVVLGIPDDFCWPVKYGVIADLLGGDGPTADDARGDYCRQLYMLGVSIGKKPITVLQAEVQDVLINVGSIDDHDKFNPNWQNVTPTVPTDLLQISPNLFALYPVPDATYTITLDIARSMPVPSAGSDFIQVSPDLLTAILNLAQHIACLKLAGQEFMTTIELRDNCLRLAAQMNNRLRANNVYNLLLTQPATRQAKEVPRIMEPTAS